MCSIGRQEGSTVCLSGHAGVSRVHAVITFSEGAGYQLADTNSTNGTFRNGERITSAVTLADGDRIRLGLAFEMKFRQIVNDDGHRAAGLTSMQVYRGKCWILGVSLFQLERSGSSPEIERQKWISQLRTLLGRHSANGTRYTNEQIIAYWHDRDGAPERLEAVLRDLASITRAKSRPGSEWGAILHLGEVQISGSAAGERITGTEFELLRASADVPKRARVEIALTTTAAQALAPLAQNRSLGLFHLAGINAREEFFCLDRNPPPQSEHGPRHRLLLVQEDTTLAEGLARLLDTEPDMQVDYRATTAAQAKKQFVSSAPDAVIIDLDFTGGASLTMLTELSSLGPQVPLVAMTARIDSALAERAYRAGALGVILKTESAIQVVRALRAILAGGAYFSPQIANPVLRRLASEKAIAPTAEAGVDALTDRELEVLQLIAAGLQNRAIATALGVSVKTIETHKENLKSKLGADSSSELQKIAKERCSE